MTVNHTNPAPPQEPLPPTPGLAIVLIAITLLICTVAAMRLDRSVVRGASESVTAYELRVDLNSASDAEIQLLPMIGPVLAERIVEDREANGPFDSLDDLARVRGIGRTTIQRIEPYVTVGP